MIESLGRMTILVRDQDEALKFYTDVLGCTVIADIWLDNGFRALHVGPQGIDGAGFWLMPANGEEQLARVGRQTAGEPIGVFYTSDCRGTVDALKAKGVIFRVDPVAADGAVFAHMLDLYGNEFVIVELAEAN